MTFSPHWLQINDQVMNFYTVTGDDPPVILLHGGGWWPVLADSPLLAWGPTLEVLEQRRRAVALDWLACEPSKSGSRTNQPQASLEPAQILVDCLDNILDTLNLGSVALVGLSMGGAVAIEYALRYPKRVEKLALVSPFGLHDRLPLHQLLYLYLNIPLLDNLAWGLLLRMRWMLRPSLRFIVHNKRVLTSALLDLAWEVARASTVSNTFFTWLKTEVAWKGMRMRYMDRIADLSLPVLLVHGEKDRLVPVACAEEAHRRIPKSELVVVPECGHWPQREYAPAFHRALFDFLRID